jgi:hypothetical protein
MTDIGPLITGDEYGWRPSIGQPWQWRYAGLLGEDVVWLEKMLALAHEGHPLPDRCWITFEYLRG